MKYVTLEEISVDLQSQHDSASCDLEYLLQQSIQYLLRFLSLDQSDGQTD